MALGLKQISIATASIFIAGASQFCAGDAQQNALDPRKAATNKYSPELVHEINLSRQYFQLVAANQLPEAIAVLKQLLPVEAARLGLPVRTHHLELVMLLSACGKKGEAEKEFSSYERDKAMDTAHGKHTMLSDLGEIYRTTEPKPVRKVILDDDLKHVETDTKENSRGRCYWLSFIAGEYASINENALAIQTYQKLFGILQANSVSNYVLDLDSAGRYVDLLKHSAGKKQAIAEAVKLSPLLGLSKSRAEQIVNGNSFTVNWASDEPLVTMNSSTAFFGRGYKGIIFANGDGLACSQNPPGRAKQRWDFVKFRLSASDLAKLKASFADNHFQTIPMLLIAPSGLGGNGSTVGIATNSNFRQVQKYAKSYPAFDKILNDLTLLLDAKFKAATSASHLSTERAMTQLDQYAAHYSDSDSRKTLIKSWLGNSFGGYGTEIEKSPLFPSKQDSSLSRWERKLEELAAN